MTKLFTYVMGPIDCWEGWNSDNDIASAPYRDVAYWGPDTVREQLLAAEEAARSAGWEGDGNPRITMLPIDETHCEIVIALKQGNNGTTFIITPFEMPWLGQPYGSVRKGRW